MPGSGAPRVLWERALHPRRGFLERAGQAPSLSGSIKGMLLFRTPFAFLGMVLGYLGFSSLYARLAAPDSGFWVSIIQQFPDSVDPGELRAALERLPTLPGLGPTLPYLALLSPLMVLSLWLHDATFDHMGLWLLGGLRARRSFRVTLVADAEALKVGALGAALALLTDLPGTGPGLTLLLAPVAIYFWIIRGYALAAWHGCPPWKGILATILNVVLALLMVLVMILACVLMVILML